MPTTKRPPTIGGVETDTKLGRRLQKLEALARLFQTLVRGPQPGLFSWEETLTRYRDEVAAVVNGERDDSDAVVDVPSDDPEDDPDY